MQCFDVAWAAQNLESILPECHKITFQNITTWDITEEIHINQEITLESTNGTYLNLAENGLLMIE